MYENDKIYSFWIEETGTPKTQIFLNPGEKYIFGRDKDSCDYVIPHQEVSRIHATINCKQDEVVIVLDGDGDCISRNGIYDANGDRITIQKNLNPGEFLWVFLNSDFSVKLTYLEVPRETEPGLNNENHSGLMRVIDQLSKEVKELRTRLDEHISKQTVAIRRIVRDEVEILNKEQGISESIKQIKKQQEETNEEIRKINKINDDQNNKIQVALFISFGIALVFGLSGSIQEMTKEEKKEWLNFTREAAVMIGSGYGLYKLKQNNDEKKE